jgi:lipoate---protein ligase
MNVFDFTCRSAAENLACDEALLDFCETNGGSEVLRFWEPTEFFVVTGYGNKVESEVNVAACVADGIPIFRRSSGGGTVLQGPGCLNYALILRIEPGGPLHSIPASNRFIMDRNRTALESALNGSGNSGPVAGVAATTGGVAVHGHTDLTVGGRKFSGNAQRRQKRFLLFHGTFLLQMDLSRIEKYLAMPSRQPTYREGRPHGAFVTNLDIAAECVKRALRLVWNATGQDFSIPAETISLLARDKYETNEWNRKL